MATILGGTILLLAVFVFFCAFRYMDRKEDLPERILFVALGVLTLVVGVGCIYMIIVS